MSDQIENKIVEIVKKMSSLQKRQLLNLACAISTEAQEKINEDSDWVDTHFSEVMRTRLLFHHSYTKELYNKKAFEWAFLAACIERGWNAQMVDNTVNSGADIFVNGEGVSLKTEAAQTINIKYLTISKFAEARWIRECSKTNEFCDMVKKKIMDHIQKYKRIFMLRAFREGEVYARYDMIEIPWHLFLLVKNLTPDSFSLPTKNNSTSSMVKLHGRNVYRVCLDGSVEKITIRNLSVEDCITHAQWWIPLCFGKPSGKK